jgi:3-deoxy-D-manno-octulosonate 8-phosphate phosphatase (KDO 8-P phosphatase)
MDGLVTEAAPDRARRARLVLTDCDGVLTDGGVYYSAEGEELVRFCRQDGLGVERLRLAGIDTAVLTREQSAIVQRRADKLGIRVFAGAHDKLAELPAILKAFGRELAEVAYIGDDLNDLGVMRLIAPHGLLGAPADAQPLVARTVHVLCTRRGGHGAFREFAEFVLKHQDEREIP